MFFCGSWSMLVLTLLKFYERNSLSIFLCHRFVLFADWMGTLLITSFLMPSILELVGELFSLFNLQWVLSNIFKCSSFSFWSLFDSKGKCLMEQLKAFYQNCGWKGIKGSSKTSISFGLIVFNQLV